jgi:hypothetical protein
MSRPSQEVSLEAQLALDRVRELVYPLQHLPPLTRQMQTSARAVESALSSLQRRVATGRAGGRSVSTLEEWILSGVLTWKRFVPPASRDTYLGIASPDTIPTPVDFGRDDITFNDDNLTFGTP